MTILKGEKVSLHYEGEESPVLKNIDFTIEKARITLFLGKSGSGKTSLLKCLSHILPLYQGKISYLGKSLQDMNIQERVHAIGFVSQQFHLFPHMTVKENCIHPQVHVLKRSFDEAEKTAEKLLQQLGMASFSEQRPQKLSGGQQQRVAIARALCMDSQILLLDEPTSALDPESTEQLQNLLQQIKERGVTIVLSTHDMTFAKGFMDRAFLMEKGEIVDAFDAQKQELLPQNMIYKFIHNIKT